jgi:hypothetical protein
MKRIDSMKSAVDAAFLRKAMRLWRVETLPRHLERAFSLLMESEARLYDFELTRFLHANRRRSSGQA